MSRPSLPSACPRRRALVLGLPLAAALAVPGSRARAQARRTGELLVGGTGAGLAPLRTLLEGVRPRVSFVPSLGSGGGIKALAAGAIDIALSARRPTDAERASGLVERELFRTPLVWAVNDTVATTRLALADLADLYAGRVERWRDGQPVRLVLRPESDSDTLLARAASPVLAQALSAAAQRPGVRVAMTDDDAVDDIERIAGAIGVTTLAVVMPRVRPLRVVELDGVVPGVATLASGRYALRKSVFVLTRAQPQPEVAAVVQQLFGRAAAEALARAGCVQTPDA